MSDPRYAQAWPQTAAPAPVWSQGGPPPPPAAPFVAARSTTSSANLRRWANGTLAAALVSMGLMAGIFFAFTVSVMPGLQASDDKTFVTAMQHINAAIENGLFGLVFTGALLFTAVAAILLFKAGRRTAAVWAAVATVLYFLVLMLTMGIEVPLNNKLAQAGDPAHIHNLHQVRKDFEGTWIPVNNARTFLNTLALLALAPALWRPSKSQ